MRSWIYLFVAIVAEVIGTTSMKFAATHSPLLGHALMYAMIGLRKRWVGLASIVCVLAAFTALAQAVKDIPLSMAYAIWGGFGILATVAMGWALFGQRLAGRGWLGLLLLLGGMGLLKLA